MLARAVTFAEHWRGDERAEQLALRLQDLNLHQRGLGLGWQLQIF